jgi:hypothetical protein
MSDNEERVWAFILANRKASPEETAMACGVSKTFVRNLISRIGSSDWHQPVASTRTHNVGNSDYAKHKIQPWDIWLEYQLNPWDADIVKRVLRNKEGERRRDYEKIMHICQERIAQLDNGTNPGDKK